MIGRVLKYMRRKKRLRQKDLSQMVGVAQSTLSGYENDTSHADFEIIEKIAAACNFEIVFISKGDGEKITTKNVNRKDIPTLKE